VEQQEGQQEQQTPTDQQGFVPGEEYAQEKGPIERQDGNKNRKFKPGMAQAGQWGARRIVA
jgi:hypothetical protein